MDTSNQGVDIFLSHEWPAGITQPGAGAGAGLLTPAPPANLSASTFSHPVARAAAALQPRYHFAGSSGQFWERSPYKNTKNGGAEHATRFISLGEVGNKNKQRWFYAFNLVPLANASEEVLKASVNAMTTESPLASIAELVKKRGHMQEEAGSFFWDNKRARNEPPSGYVCRRCNQPGHFIKDCTAEQEGPSSTSTTGNLPEGYICNICHNPGHWIRDCPEAATRRATGTTAGQDSRNGGPRSKALAQPPPPCWFCLSNPEVDKNLIVSIGTEMYLTMAKGQLPNTTPPSKSLIPGGGHILLITINHYSSFRTVDAEARSDLESELKKYKEGLSKLFHSKGAAMVTWELSQGGRMQHAHVQILAVPQDKVEDIERQFKDDVESFFLAERPGSTNQQQQQPPTNTAAWQDQMPESSTEGFLKVELPNNKVLVCPIPERQWVDAQFGRTVLAKALGTPDRANWRNCVKTAEEERKDSQAFKIAFKDFDFTL
ncbi:CwfJ C-terminus 1-domain-containing protein-like protein [Dissophora ornata]|nr:CwfJ C-terminus 1-domain-containing protein-like protein [Dissophora ornata]